MGPAVERRKVGIGAEGAVVAAEGGTDVDDVEGAGLEGEGRGAELEGAVLVGVDVGVVVVGGGGGEEEEDARRKKRDCVELNLRRKKGLRKDLGLA